ncbi:MAG TPA: type I polyketide synthase, partial [Opitutaceae bacterium]
EGKETIRFFTAEDALKAGVDPELVRNPNHVRAAPMLDAPEAFDAEFFKYTAKEARLIDPQQRVFLEVCWEAFEDAGYDPLSFPGRVGLFAAAGMNTYLANNLLANGEFLQEENGGRMLTVDSMSGFNVMITNDKDYLPTRVSYKLNLRGPSLNIQTACSSTLVTLHEACNSLLVGDCEMALAGGVSIKLPQHAGHLYSAGMLNSPDGHCRAYDEKAEGTIFGNGAGVVLLKPLSAALADGDRIYAVVKGTATNNDGGGKVGFTAPSATGEEDVCAQALARAGFSADTVTFMEGHGTGTPLGDPIEVNALSAAFRRDTPRTGYCALGSVKTNVGHLQIASGIAGLIKTALALHHKAIPGTLHFEKPNPRIDFSRTPFYVTRETRAWDVSGHPRRAGVNSLGIGGSNVHAILEEAPAAQPAPAAAPAAPEVLPLSARHPRALRQLALRYADLLESPAAPALEDLAYTAQVGRAALPLRAAFVGASPVALVAQLRAFAAQEEALPGRVDFEKDGLAFLYRGETGGLPTAARALYDREPAFRAAFDRCAEILDTELGVPFLRTPWSDAAEFDHATACAYQYALGELLASYGIEPTRVAGQGLGEYAAACRAGVFALEDALRLAAARDKLSKTSANAAALRQFSAIAESIEYGTPALAFVTDGDPATAGYWLHHAQ